MTDKASDKIGQLKCPFCGAELLPHNEIENTEPIGARCGKPGCPWFMWNFPWEIWQALIDGKKAQDALKIAIQELNSLIEPVNNQDDYRNSVLTQFGLNRAINEIKRKITSITKQEE